MFKSNSAMNESTIPEFYRGKNVFITGGTGFMGKVLVEKLLRSCPDLNAIYLLIRNKNTIDKSERWNKITHLPLFDKLRTTNPHVLSKVHLIEGTIEEDDLSLSREDKDVLINTVDIVFHCAAAVQFSESIVYSLKQNTKGTYSVANLAKSMKNLKAMHQIQLWSNLNCFVYSSTAYSNCDKNTTIEEKLYPAPQDWRVLLDLLDTDPDSLALLKDKLTCGHPSTYTLTKAMSEQVMNDFSQYYPVIIVRPSIILGTLEDPFEGWCDVLNGASTLMMIVGLGLIRVVKVIPTSYLDYITVDHAVKVLIIGSWITGKRVEKQGLEVLSCNYGKELTLSVKEIIDSKNACLGLCPTKNLVWYPLAIGTSNPVLYTIFLFLFQIFPSLLIDIFLKFMGRKPMLINVTQKYVKAFNGPLASFQMKQFSFPNNNFKRLMKLIRDEDKDDFSINIANRTPKEIFLINVKGTLQYYLKEDISDRTYAQRKSHVDRIKYLHYALCGFLMTALVVLICRILI